MSSNEDIIRVFRLVTYTGPRSMVDKQLENSIHGSQRVIQQGKVMTINATSIGTFPDLLKHADPEIGTALDIRAESVKHMKVLPWAEEMLNQELPAPESGWKWEKRVVIERVMVDGVVVEHNTGAAK